MTNNHDVSATDYADDTDFYHKAREVFSYRDAKDCKHRMITDFSATDSTDYTNGCSRLA